MKDKRPDWRPYDFGNEKTFPQVSNAVCICLIMDEETGEERERFCAFWRPIHRGFYDGFAVRINVNYYIELKPPPKNETEIQQV